MLKGKHGVNILNIKIHHVYQKNDTMKVFKNKRIINKVNNALDELRNAVDTEEILYNKNSEKIIGIAEDLKTY